MDDGLGIGRADVVLITVAICGSRVDLGGRSYAVPPGHEGLNDEAVCGASS
jgi:hypothetical protein